ncbi:protein DsrB [Providencia vermicola]
MKINDRVYVKTDGQERREGKILLIETFNEGIMYLVSLPEYPGGIWFFNEKEGEMGYLSVP